VLNSTSVPPTANGSSRLSTWTFLYLLMAASVHVCDLGTHAVSVSRLDEGDIDSRLRMLEARTEEYEVGGVRIVLKRSE